MAPVDSGDGSAFFEMGNSKVLAVVYGPREPAQRGQDRATVTCDYSMSSFSTGERRKRMKGDRRSTEAALVLRQTLESAILTELYPRTQIHICIQVLQADGGQQAVGLNAAVMALVEAGIALRDLVACSTCGYLDATPLLDLNYTEDGGGGPNVQLALHPALDKVVLLQTEDRLRLEVFEQVLDLAMDGCRTIARFMKETAVAHAKELAVA
eukprot:gene21284-25576_t